MAAERHTLIRYLTSQLSREIAVSVFQEYMARVEKIDGFLRTDRFIELRSDRNTIDLLLAATIFHKRIVSNLDSASKFFRKVTGNSDAETIKIGTYVLTGDERKRILAAVISFNKLMEKYTIPYWFFQYYSNDEFLQHVIRLKNGEKQN